MELITYHHFFEETKEMSLLLEALQTRELQYRASDLLQYGFSNNDLNLAVKKAMTVCNTGHIPLRANFKRVYISNEHEIASDWMLSALARKLVLLNADVNNPVTARIQLNLTQKR